MPPPLKYTISARIKAGHITFDKGKNLSVKLGGGYESGRTERIKIGHHSYSLLQVYFLFFFGHIRNTCKQKLYLVTGPV
jgi:hypothetical protein